MSRRFNLFLFDLDGTLINSRKDISGSINRMLKELDLPAKEESLISTYVGQGVNNLIRKSLGDTDEKLFDRALKLFKRDYDTHCLDFTKLYPGVEETLRHIEGMKVVVTNKPFSYSEKILKGLGIHQYFELLLGGDMHFAKKPSPEAVYYLIEKFGNVPKENILFVGDSLLDIHTAKNSGVMSCGVTYGFGTREELENACPDYLLDSFGELLEIVR